MTFSDSLQQLDIDSITKQNAININISIEHRNNWQDWGGRVSFSSSFLLFSSPQLTLVSLFLLSGVAEPPS